MNRSEKSHLATNIYPRNLCNLRIMVLCISELLACFCHELTETGCWVTIESSQEQVLSQLSIPIPDDAMAALNLSPVEAAEEFRFAAAAKLYELGRLSSGAAASLAGVPRTVFLARLSEYGVSVFDVNEEELKQDFSRA